MKNIYYLLLIIILPFNAFSQSAASIKLASTDAANTIFKNKVLTKNTFTVANNCTYKEYYQGSGGTYNGKNYYNINLGWSQINNRWELTGFSDAGLDVFGYFSGDLTMRVPPCGAAITSANSDAYIATLSIENQSGTGCYAATCAAPTTTPSLGSTTASGCKESAVNITASCTTGNAVWYSCPSNTCSNPATSSTACRIEYDDFSVYYNTTGTYKYQVACQNECGSGAYTEVTVTINDLPALPTSPSAQSNYVCSGSGAILSANCGGNTVKWYKRNNSSGILTYEGSGNPYTTQPITDLVTTTYYPSCFTGSCESGTHFQTYVSINIHSVSSSTASVNPICGSGSSSLSATCSNGETPRWYDSITAGTLLYTGSPYSVTQSSTTNYYVDCSSTTCTIPRRQLTITNETAGSPFALDKTFDCGTTGSTTLNGSGCTSSYSLKYQWYANATGGTPLSYNKDYTVSIPATTTIYYLECTTAFDCRSSRLAVTIHVGASQPTDITNQTICSNTSASLSATCNSGQTVKWYTALTGATLLYTGSPYTTSNLTSTTNFYVACSSSCGESSREEVTVSIDNTIPNQPYAEDLTICSGNTATLVASCEGMEEAKWYSASVGGILLYTGSYYDLGNPTSNHNYYVSCSSLCNESTRKTVHLTVSPSIAAIPTNVSVSQTTCRNEVYNGYTYDGVAILQATCAPGTTVTWFYSYSDTFPFATGEKILYKFYNNGGSYVSCTTEGGCSSDKVEVQVSSSEEYGINITTNGDGSKNYTATGCNSPVTWTLGKVSTFETLTTMSGNPLNQVRTTNAEYFISYACDNTVCINDGLECPMGSFGNNNKLSITENYATGVIVKSGNKSFNGGSNGKVVIEAANQISGTAKVVYEAPSVLLKPGFKATATPQQAVFIAKVGNGCYQDPSANVRIRTDK